MKKLELLAPGGDLEKVKIAIDYGADAVYCAGEMFGLRASAKNLTVDELADAVSYVHEKGKKLYLTINIFAHNEDIDQLCSYLKGIRHIPIDAFIVSDPGVMMVVKAEIPDANIHLSTQANTTNYQSAAFWHQQGVSRIVLAREMSFEEIKKIRANIPDSLELEAFIQGAMCISYSGRCLLSNFMIERDANRGECAHPCRWKYHLVEEERPGEYYPVYEDEKGTYIFNSKDLCMLEYIPQIAESGISSVKIEGRMKSIFYVATVVSVYRACIDAYYEDPENYAFDQTMMTELQKVSHRNFTTGFYFDKPSNADQNYLTSSYTRAYDFVGLIKAYHAEESLAYVEQRNKFSVGDTVEIFGPNVPYFAQQITEMYDADRNPIESAPHAQQKIFIKVEQPVGPQFMIRKYKE